MFSGSCHLGWTWICPSLHFLVCPFLSPFYRTFLPSWRSCLPQAFFFDDSTDQPYPYHCCSPAFLHFFDCFRFRRSALTPNSIMWILQCSLSMLNLLCYVSRIHLVLRGFIFCQEKGNCMALQTSLQMVPNWWCRKSSVELLIYTDGRA